MKRISSFDCLKSSSRRSVEIYTENLDSGHDTERSDLINLHDDLSHYAICFDSFPYLVEEMRKGGIPAITHKGPEDRTAND